MDLYGDDGIDPDYDYKQARNGELPARQFLAERARRGSPKAALEILERAGGDVPESEV